MSNDPSSDTAKTRAKDAKSEARAVEAAAIRRRWITLGETLAVLAVVISALTLWINWRERSDTEATRIAERQRTSAHAATLVLTATASGDHALILKPVSAEQVVQSQTITFPTGLGAAPAQTTGEPRIEADWFESALKKARGEAGLPGDSRGDERLPVAIATRFLVDGDVHDDVAIYDVGYTISGHWLGGHSVALRGLSLVSRAKASHVQAALDSRWARLIPRK